MIKSKREAFAEHCMLDFSETEDYRYHYGHTSGPVWAFSECYFSVTKKGQKPPTHRSGLKWNWVEVKNDYVNKDGYIIWKAETDF